MHRFYVPDIDTAGQVITLKGSIARRIKNVLRIEAGDRVQLFNGTGNEWKAEISRVGKNEISATLISTIKTIPEPSTKITMILGLARPERIELAIQKCSELGAAKFIPVISERVQGGNSGTPSPQRLKRWQRIAIESAELSRRAVIPLVAQPISLMEAINQTLIKQNVLCMWEESSDKSKSLKDALKSLKKHPDGLTALIGPPGGLSQKEAFSIQATGAQLVNLGHRVLRSETAAITVISAILYEMGDLGG
ncbi:MAG: 16S rRNA (uracil(1498)-N(3))-methyltransferase [Chloroflexi bacterium]|nr:16S rRNA (uracil(1498)-N(3))-methyltransferase [Chloroflexota bacterium]MQF81948.1 16S rRNA (uracil(1498)-N(3))-methyltransferase [SAR202 cluster bacterium]|tara:strand:- start:1912 stop:2664 length:753 start_codon:yes stop_codon:yes gene_type:complete